MLARDIHDAFGYVSHVRLGNNLSHLGLHPLLSEVILYSYSNSKGLIITLNGATEPIEIKRGIKQGCPLSPILFDIYIDPLIEKLSSQEFKSYGYWWGDNDGVTAQAYADDILLFANSYDNMMELIRAVQDFIRESNIQPNPKKYHKLKIGKDSHDTFPLI
jgi:hypothetical protein